MPIMPNTYEAVFTFAAGFLFHLAEGVVDDPVGAADGLLGTRRAYPRA